MTTSYVSNEDISFKDFILILDSGENVGKKTKDEALQLALNRGLDLVLVHPDDKNPVCKIFDLKKKMYDDKIKEKENKSSHKKQKTKEVRLSVHTEDHDLRTKANSISKFINQKYKVKICIRFPQRQKDTIKSMVQEIFDQLTSYLNTEFEYEISSGSYADNSYFTEITPKTK